jgi:hypothetical protein
LQALTGLFLAVLAACGTTPVPAGDGAGSSGNLFAFGGSGPDAKAGGAANGLFIPSAGNETLVCAGASGASVFENTPRSRRVGVIVGFNPAPDAIRMF